MGVYLYKGEPLKEARQEDKKVKGASFMSFTPLRVSAFFGRTYASNIYAIGQLTEEFIKIIAPSLGKKTK